MLQICFLKEINVFIIIACYLKLQDLNNVLQISDPTFNVKKRAQILERLLSSNLNNQLII